MIIPYSVLHLLVDGVCALAMFGRFIPQEGGYFSILLYNFCAFALQMPLGTALDALHERWEKKKTDLDLLTAAAGVVCTIAGALTHPIVLGIGNALFHVGGGVGTIRGSGGHGNRLIVRLGIFVAPGALGLYAGTLLAQGGRWNPCFWGASALMLFVCGGMLCIRPRRAAGNALAEAASGTAEVKRCTRGRWCFVGSCLIVVVLRSYIGMAVSFSWKAGVLAGSLSVLAVAGGKTAGGFAAARKGAFPTAAVSLIAAAGCYLFSGVMPVGLAALFLFNMTMPITLYWMVRAFPQMPGFAFGCLTFALFLGFVPAYLGVPSILSGKLTGCAGSMVSLLLLAVGAGLGRRKDEEAVKDTFARSGAGKEG